VKKLALAAALALLPSAALAADVSGDWNVAGEFAAMGIKFQSACKLAQDTGGKVTGSCTGTQNEAAPTTGAVTTGADGKTAVEFAYDTSYQGSPVHLDFKGALGADGAITGAVDAGGADGTFTATKGPPPAAAPAAPAAAPK
jgi:opacity protein-like surface antigen